MNSRQGKAMHATFWSFMELSVRYGIQLVVMIAMARLLGPDDFGLVAMVMVFAAVGMLMVDAGFGLALVQRQNTGADEETSAFVANVTIAVATSATIFLLAPTIAAFYGEPRIVALTQVISLVFPLTALSAVPDALLIQRMQFRDRARIELGASLTSGALGVYLAVAGFGVWSLIWQAVAALGVRALLLWFRTRWLPRGRVRLDVLRGLFGFGGYMLAANLFDTLYTRLQALVVGKLFSSQDLGYYALAQSSQQVPTTLVATVLNRVGLPLFSAIADDRGAQVYSLRRALRASMFVFAPMMVAVAALSRPMVVIVFGDEWTPVAPILSALALAGALWPWHVLNLVVINALGRSDLVLRVEVLKKVVSIGLLILSSRWGIQAIAWSVLMASIFAALINTHYTRLLLGYGAGEQFRDLTPTLALIAVTIGVGRAVQISLGEARMAPAIALVTGMAVYLGLAFAFRHPAIAQSREMLRSWRGHRGA